MSQDSTRLALEGGTPVRKTMLPYSRQSISEEDRQAVLKALDAPIITRGPEVKAFEEEIADYVGFPQAVAFHSATAGLHAAMACLGVRAGDLVSMPALTFAATANAARYCGADVEFVDIREDTLNVNEKELLGRKSRLKVFVDYAGNPADTRLLKNGKDRELHLVDAAHSLSARLDGKPAAQFADIAVYSFHPVKPITSAEGGAVVTRDASFADALRVFRNHGIHQEESPGYSPQRSLGFNYHMTELQAALGRSQLKRLDAFRQKREALAQAYETRLPTFPFIKRSFLTTGAESARHLYPVRVDLAALGLDKARLMAAMKAENIGVQVHYMPVYWHPYYADLGFQRGLCPRTESAFEELLSLPLHPQMEESDVEDVCRALEKLAK